MSPHDKKKRENAVMSKRVYVAYTGGTLGMQASENGFVPARNFLEPFFTSLGSAITSQFSFTFNEYTELIDSSNATPQDWLDIARDVKAHYQDHDAFLILHGTDTMAYTASALSFWLQGLDKPVVITGSQIPFCLERSDAVSNVTNALAWLKMEALSEVGLCFHDRLLRGNASSKVKATQLDAFDSLNQPWLGKMAIKPKLNYANLLPKPISGSDWQLPTQADNNVAVLRIFPSMTANLLKCAFDSGYTGVILQSYGTGNAPDKDLELLQTIEGYTAEGKIIVNLSQCPYGEVDSAYATGSRLAQAGVISGNTMTVEAAFTKLHVLLQQSTDRDDVIKLFQQNLCGELSQL
ncbi:L-asparaginase 1 [Pokkaliibacter plantistimulans]|uniref:asparaginase n=2 Tax=Pseudomonadota TaxID=1224 RepID=A0A2S5KMP6_9PROT|nr:L-asparaginase 1 [Pokkaliibacter plantistimulans]